MDLEILSQKSMRRRTGIKTGRPEGKIVEYKCRSHAARHAGRTTYASDLTAELTKALQICGKLPSRF